MKNNFYSSLQLVLKEEGGWSEHPKDPGGCTMKGITLYTFRNHFGFNKTPEDLKNITEGQLSYIYKLHYWDKSSCDLLPDGLDLSVFDFAVNSGYPRANKFIQSIVGTDVDGIIGKNTLKCISNNDTIELINKLCDNRLVFLKGLKTWQYFGRGWSNRVARVRFNSIKINRKKDEYQ